MDRDRAAALLERLHAAQGVFYAGGPDAALRKVLAPDVVWRVPGAGAIGGVHEGLDAVLAYFARRRDLANRTFRLHPGELLVGDGEHVAVLTDGTAFLGGVSRRWRTVGLYRLRGDRVAECALLPLDPVLFDELWGAR